ncbi:MAG: response regulator transcription factor [Chitinispirillaceae bacterium]|nr:response regulator transcription factor [Chitinispirillaceae bacterium]
MKQKILIVEDDPSILTGVVDLLESEGYAVFSAVDGREALFLYGEHHPDLLLLDIMIPVISGYDVCREVRTHDHRTPILMLTAKSQEVEKVIGLELGADDYIVKPFGIHELLARIRAALRRATVPDREPTPEILSFGNVTIEPAKLQGTIDGNRFELTQRECNLLEMFIRNDGLVLDRNALLTNIWGVHYEGTTRTLDQHIAKLRQKIETDPSNPRHIKTVHGTGYRFCSNG